MIIYASQCLGCFYKKRMREIKDFARMHNLSIDERRINYNKQWQDEALNLVSTQGISLPILKENNKVIHFTDDLEKLL